MNHLFKGPVHARGQPCYLKKARILSLLAVIGMNCLFLFGLIHVGVASARAARPIIGILTVPVEHNDCTTLSTTRTEPIRATSCFHSLYVKWLEAAGARVVPLPFDMAKDDFAATLSSINGALITGGETDIKTISSAYMTAAQRLYNHSLTLHNNGETWPLWGTCMGMQVLSIIGADNPDVLLSDAYDSEDLVLPLSLTPAATSSALLCDTCLPSSALDTLRTANVTVNLHHDGVAPASFAPGSKLGSAFKVLSTNVDNKGKAFASTIEAASGAPIWGVQWHPERPQFEWKPRASDHFNHDAAAIAAMFAVATRLVSAARQNARQYADESEESRALIYNYSPVGSADGGSYQAYFFGNYNLA